MTSWNEYAAPLVRPSPAPSALMWKRSVVSPLSETVEARTTWKVPLTCTRSPQPGTLNANGRSWFVTTEKFGGGAVAPVGAVAERSHAMSATTVPVRMTRDIRRAGSTRTSTLGGFVGLGAQDNRPRGR